MNFTDLMKELESLTLDSEGGRLKRFFPELDPSVLEDLRERVWKRIEEEERKKQNQST